MLLLTLFLNSLTFDLIISLTNNCTSAEYRNCGDNEPMNCISKEWWCDGHPDCENGKDEANCPMLTCLHDEFLCHSATQCIPKLLHCDGVAHCLDKSDEKSCKTVELKSCNSLTEFDCNKDGINCVPLERVCDGKNDCGRNEDELPGGSVFNCQRNDCQLIANGGCSHFCSNFFTHIKCHCPDGHQLLPDNKTCVDIDECAAWPPKCSQTCNNTSGGYYCQCHYGYKQTSDNPGKCIAEDGDRSLLVTLSGGRLLTINLNTGSNHSTILNEHPETWPKVDVDLHQMPQTIFWSAQSSGFIGKVKFNKNSKRDATAYRFLFQNQLSTNRNESFCTGLSFDWLRSLLFWTSAAENRIYVTNSISNDTALLLSKDLHNPRSIVVNPFTTMLYWTVWKTKESEAKIEMMLMNTQKRKTLIGSGLRQPLDLVIDFVENRLYWSDINPGSISYIDLNKPGIPKTVISNKLMHPFSIAVFENKIYWSDWRQNQVISSDKMVGNDFTVLARINKPFSVRILHSLSQPLITPSQAKSHSCLKSELNPCSHICLPFPPTSKEKGSGTEYRCMCPVGSFLGWDNKSCLYGDSSAPVYHPMFKFTKSNRYQIILGVVISLVFILCLSLSIICVYVCRQRSWAHSNKSNNRKLFNHPIVTGDLMFIFKCNSHSSQLSELLANEFSSASSA